MARHKQMTDTVEPSVVYTYTTRSSAQKSLNVNVDQGFDQLCRFDSTPTTPITDQSTDIQRSSVSSRTSNTISKSPTRPCRTIQLLIGEHQPSTDTWANGVSGSIISNPVPQVETAEIYQSRPSRTRKPTSKAAELAANAHSKLFKSTQESSKNTYFEPSLSSSISDDSEYHLEGEETQSLPEDHVTGGRDKGHFPKERPAIEVSNGISSLKPLTETVREPRKHNEEPAKHLLLPITVARKRRRVDNSESTFQSSENSRHITADQITRPHDQVCEPDIRLVKAKPASSFTEKSRSMQRKSNAEAGEIADDSGTQLKIGTATVKKSPSPTAVLQTTHRSSRSSKLSTKLTEKASKSTERPASSPPLPTVIPEAQPTPTKKTPNFSIKVKPIVPCADSALEGVTGLPCGLICLGTEGIIYAMARFVAEHEDLAEKIASVKDFEKDFGDQTCLLRCRFNIVMAEFCACGECDGVRAGGAEAESKGSAGKTDDYDEDSGKECSIHGSDTCSGKGKDKNKVDRKRNVRQRTGRSRRSVNR